MARLGPPSAPTGKSTPGRNSALNTPGGVSNPVSASSRFDSSSRPPRAVVGVAVVNTLAALVLIALAGTEKADLRHYFGTALGMFVSVALIGWFRQRLAISKSDGRFLDWRVSSSRVMTSVTTFAWIAGAANLFVICYELSRRFTS